MKCSKCGKEIANDSNFCEYCGVRVVRNEVNKKKSYGKYWLIAILIFIVMVIHTMFNFKFLLL